MGWGGGERDVRGCFGEVRWVNTHAHSRASIHIRSVARPHAHTRRNRRVGGRREEGGVGRGGEGVRERDMDNDLPAAEAAGGCAGDDSPIGVKELCKVLGTRAGGCLCGAPEARPLLRLVIAAC